jgi:hypothetical protein
MYRTPLLAVAAATMFVASLTEADVVFQQPPNPTGTFYLSARWGENGSDYDEWVWDNFTLAQTRSVTEIHWRGGYTGPVSSLIGFQVAIYNSIGGGSQPDLSGPPIVNYFFDGNGGETAAGSAGGVAVYDYGVTLPQPFVATGGVKYWVLILAWQNGIPFWSLQKATTTGSHFRFSEGLAMYHIISGDTAFYLVSPPLPCPADLNGSGAVDAADLSILLGAWGSAGGPSDLNGDGAVNAADLSVLLGAWGTCG